MAKRTALLLLAAAAPAWCSDAGTCAAPGACGGQAEADESLLMQAKVSAHRLRVELGAKDRPTLWCGDPSSFYDCASPLGLLQEDGADAWGTPTPPPKPYPVPCPTKDAHAWCDPAMNAETRAKLIVANMSLDELAAQVSCDIFEGVPAIERLGVNAYNYIRENNHGLLWNNVCPIPTVFPQAITMGATFNRTLWTAIGKAAAIEARYNFDEGKQNSLFLQTNFNIFIDPRWGRGQEVPGEDPGHTSEYATAWIEGVQAPEGPGGVPLAAMSCKHFTAYSYEGAGGWAYPVEDMNRHNFDAVVKEVDLADTHFPVYQACAKAGAKGMMSSYNAVNGVPMAANGPFTNGLAREKWGFKGSVVTDCGAVDDIWQRHKYVATAAEAATVALKGGTDIECGSTIKTAGATKKNKKLLTQAVERSFQVRVEVGEFNPPVGSPGGKMYDQAAHAQLAFDAAVQGSVLLKNEGSALPLKQGAKVALLGPLADGNWELLGNYAGYKDAGNWSDSPNVVSVLQGLKQCGMVGELVKTSPIDKTFTHGICAPSDEIIAGTNLFYDEPDADVVVIVGGLYPQDEQLQDPDRRPDESGKCQAGCLESEGCDRHDLQLAKGQQMLLERAMKWKLPVVLVIVGAGPLDLSLFDGQTKPHAILWTGYPGQQGGMAIAHMLFGLQSPSGKLSQTYYKNEYTKAVSIRDMDMRSNAKTGYPGRTYRFVDEKYVQYPFGYGLSYDTWSYELTQRISPAPATGPSGFVGCSVGLTVTLDSDPRQYSYADPSEVVLLFLTRPDDCPLAKKGLAPNVELARFERARASRVGQMTDLDFHFEEKDFTLADAKGLFQLQEGTWTGAVGSPRRLGFELLVSSRGCEVKPASVECPGSPGHDCAGNQCCPGTAASGGKTFACPSADAGFKGCEVKPDANVECPGSPGHYCAGNQCCPGTAASGGKTFACPSADAGFKGCECPWARLAAALR